jgi:type II secretory pathway pseudopilin PulG
MTRRASIKVPDNCASRGGERGFALLEILVAFVILALGLGAILTGVAVAMRSDGRAQVSRVALRLAQSRLEEAGVGGALLPGHREGRMTANYRWKETITAVDLGAEPLELRGVKPTQTTANAGFAPFWVEVTVQAADGTVAKLGALKLAPETKQPDLKQAGTKQSEATQ